MMISPSHHFELYFEDDELEKIEADLKRRGFAFVHEIREQPWRLHREGHPSDEISRITYLPVAKVREAVEQYEH